MTKKGRSRDVPPPIGGQKPSAPAPRQPVGGAPGLPFGLDSLLGGKDGGLGDMLVAAGEAINTFQALQLEREARRIKMEELRRRVKRSRAVELKDDEEGDEPETDSGS